MSNLSNTIIYEDKDVKITQKELIIKFYYFPICTSKTIPLKNIKMVQKNTLGWAKGRLWGMDATRWGYWLAGDLKRLSRQEFIGIHIQGKWIKPSFTTQKVDTVYRILKQLIRKAKGQEIGTQMKSEENQIEELQEKSQHKMSRQKPNPVQSTA